MPYKEGWKTTLIFSKSDGETIKQLAAAQQITPYALLKAIIMETLKLKEAKRDDE